MIIKDPQNLLPYSLKSNEEFSGRVLEIPSHGISLHPKSIEKILSIAKEQDSIVVFQPILPIVSELNFPSYPILAYLYPQSLSHHWEQVKQKIELILQNNYFNHLPFILISQIELGEQLHYFSHCYGKAIKPKYVRVIVGNTCNLKCVMCPYHSSSLKLTHTTDFFKDNKTMSWDMMERIAKDCGEFKTNILIGNVEEPLLHPKLFDFIGLCRQQGVPKIHLTTNGVLLNDSCSKALLNAGLTSIDISLDAADPETYFKIRGANLKKVESNIINFLQLREQLGMSCGVRVCLVRNQEVSIEEEKAFLNSWITKVNNVVILNLAEYDNNIRLKNTNNAINNSLEHYLEKAQNRWTCLFPFTEMAILPDGRIYYCVETLFRLGFDQEIESLGDYQQQTLQDIWDGDLFKQLRRDLILNQLQTRPVCKNCDLWKSQVVNKTNKDQYQVLTTTVTEIYSQAN